jgi:Pyrimidine dimer DNA glycosylase
LQTFVPYADFGRSAEVLDDKRLGKQRVEVLQIMQVLLRLRWNNAIGEIENFQPRGWTSHPAVLMWQGYERALLEYQRTVCDVWTSRGFKDTCYPKTLGLVLRWNAGTLPEYVDPPWRGDERLHRSHKSNLIRKDADLYGVLFPGVPGDEPYLWPVTKEAGIDSGEPGYSAVMTTPPPDPGDANSTSLEDEDQDSEPTSTAPEENNPTVPNPPD